MKTYTALLALFVCFTWVHSQSNTTCPTIRGRDIAIVYSTKIPSHFRNSYISGISNIIRSLQSTSDSSVRIFLVSYCNSGSDIEVTFSPETAIFALNEISSWDENCNSNMDSGLHTLNNFYNSNSRPFVDLQMIVITYNTVSYDMNAIAAAKVLKAQGFHSTLVTIGIQGREAFSYLDDVASSREHIIQFNNIAQFRDGWASTIYYHTQEISDTCFIFGGRHVFTFDGVKYNFQAKFGEYILARSDVSAYEASLKYTPSWHAYAIKSPHHTLEIYVQKDSYFVVFDGDVLHNAMEHDLPDTYLFTSYIKSNEGEQITMDLSLSDFHAFLDIQLASGWSSISITPPAEFRNTTKGLCGTYNGCERDDFTMSTYDILSPNSTAEDIFHKFVKSWARPSSSSEFSQNFKHFYYQETSPPPLLSLVPSNAAVVACQNIIPDFRAFCEFDVTHFASTLVADAYEIYVQDICEDWTRDHRINIVDDSFCTVVQKCFDEGHNDEFHAQYNSTKIPRVSLVDGSAQRTTAILPFLGGQYTLKLQGDYCAPITENTTVTIYCDHPVPIIEAEDSLYVERTPFGFPVVRMNAKVIGSGNYVYSWSYTLPATYSGDCLELLTTCDPLQLHWMPAYPGVHKFQLAVYDGCQLVTKNITVNVSCGEDCHIKLANRDHPTVVYQHGGNFYPTTSLHVTTSKLNEYLSYDWNYMLKMDNTSTSVFSVSMVEEGSKVYTITQKTLAVLINITYNAPTFDYDSDSDDDEGFSSRRGVKHTTASTTYEFQYEFYNETTHTVDHLEFPEVDVNICQISVSNYWSESAQVSFTNLVPGGCAGLHTFRATAQNECWKLHEDVYVDVLCSKPRAIINQVPTRVGFNYDTNNFPAVQLIGEDSFYQEFSTIPQHSFSVLSSPAGSNPSITNGVLSVTNAGAYTIKTTASGSCGEDSDTATINFVCTKTPVAVINAPSSMTFGTSITINSTGSSAGSISFVVNLPSGSPLTSSSASFSSGMPFKAGAGTYTVALTISDGCASATSTFPITGTCDATINVPSLAPVTWTFGTPFPSFSVASANVTSPTYNPSLSYFWNVEGVGTFGGGSVLTLADPSIGSHTVSVEVTDGCASKTVSTTLTAVCPFSTTAVITTNKPGGFYEVDDHSSFRNIQLVGTNSINATTFSWTVTHSQTGTTLTSTSSSFNFEASDFGVGVYNVTLLVTDGGCAKSTASIVIVPRCLLTLAATPTPAPTLTTTWTKNKFPKVYWAMNLTQNFMNFTLEEISRFTYTFTSSPENSMYRSKNQTTVTTQILNETILIPTFGPQIPEGTQIRRHTSRVIRTEIQTFEYTRLDPISNSLDKYPAHWNPDVPGTYTVALEVTNNCNQVIVNTVVTVNAVCNASPQVTHPATITHYINQTSHQEVFITPTISDSDGDELFYSWELTNSPNQGNHSQSTLREMHKIKNHMSSKLSFIPAAVGTYTFKISVTDGCSTTNQTVDVQVLCSRAAPRDKNILLGNYETTIGEAMFFPVLASGCGADYSWSVIGYQSLPPVLPPAPTPNNQIEEESESDNNSLSKADKVGLAVGLPLGIILLAAIIAIIILVVILLKRKQSKVSAN